MKKTMFKVTVLFMLTALLYSCYPGDASLSDLDSVTTLRTDDFTAPKKVVLWWTVHQIKDDGDNNLEYNGELDDEILNTTLQNLIALYGSDNVYIYSETDDPVPSPVNDDIDVYTPNDIPPSGVDVKILPGIVLKKNTSIGYYPPWYPGYPCWYCWYPPVWTVSSYETGTVLLGMINNPWDINDSDKGRWLAAFRGLISSNSSSNAERTVNSINQAFEQSPYLK